MRPTEFVYSAHDRCEHIHRDWIVQRALESGDNKTILYLPVSSGARADQEYSWGTFSWYFDRFRGYGLEPRTFIFHDGMSRDDAQRFFDWLFRHTRGRSGAVARSEFWGLAVFVGIPLPGFGVWTGAVLAVVMDMPFWRSMLAAFVGVLFAAAIVTTLSVLGFWGAVIAGVVLTAVLAQAIIVGFRRRRAERAAP